MPGGRRYSTEKEPIEGEHVNHDPEDIAGTAPGDVMALIRLSMDFGLPKFE
jgi:hypothetical protein